MKVAFSKSFKRAFKRKIRQTPLLEKKFWTKTELFLSSPFHQSLKTHKLSGKLAELWSFSVTHDLRVIFYFETDEKSVFIDIGSHDEVY